MRTQNVTFVRTSYISGKTRRRTYNVPVDGYDAWANDGKHIQDAMPNLTAAEREFIISGSTDEEFNELFPPEEDTAGNDYNMGSELEL